MKYLLRLFELLAFLFLIAGALGLAGCLSVPTEQASTLQQKQRENVTQKATSEFAKSLESSPAPLVVEMTSKDGETMKVSQPAPQHQAITGKAFSGEGSDSSAEGSSSWSLTVPLFVKLIGLAVGLGLLAVVVLMIRKHFTIVGAAWSFADEKVSDYIHNLRSIQTTSINPEVNAALKAAEAQAERLRAELNKD